MSRDKSFEIDMNEVDEMFAEEIELKPSVRPFLSSANFVEPILLSELKEEDLNVDWIWDGFIAKGNVTLLAALWKSGKSTLLAHLLSSMKAGSRLAGQSTTKAGVLILSEEHSSKWSQRRTELNFPHDVWLVTKPFKMKPTLREWGDFLKDYSTFCEENHIELVIVDTLASFWSVRNENDASEVAEALMPLNFLTEKNIAVLLIHHFRKSGGKDGVATRGSGALAGHSDIIIEFRRAEEGSTSSIRKLATYSRYEETPKDVVIELRDGEYRTVGDSSEYVKEAKLNKFLEAMTGINKEGWTIKEGHSFWEDNEELYGRCPSIRTLRSYVTTLLESGLVLQISEILIKSKKTPIYSISNNG